ncbi:hypothetical protein H8S95_15255 [Pontibacter sp. KCTC 32443]|uniref:hypothetical protein n=1 Tax=Pontibacter TaxID=323449 RepID=UPI00164DC5AF|nr:MULTISPECIES: hypothetical protein [Pontibacter]MBC5775435.1 hypothetical protein [Pontibacter sp. KCTC 32443]
MSQPYTCSMKSILPSLILILALISGSAIAQGNSEDNKIMSQLNTGAYSGPYHQSENKGPLIVVQDEEDYYKIDDYSEIDPNWIVNVNVLKGQKAEDAFGERGSNGVVVITLKEDDKAARKYFRTIKKNKIKV